MSRPIIGVTLDSVDPNDAETKAGYSKFPWYAVRKNYFTPLVEAGGLPVALPHETAMVEAYLDSIDGLVVTGGDFDVDPSLYGESTTHESVHIKGARTAFEWAVTAGALARDMPVFGICGGQQLLHVVLGGTLIQHIPDALPDALPHEQPNPRDEAGHTVSIERGTLLHDIVGADELAVNSAHHQAARDGADGIVLNAFAPDGVIEGIEAPKYRFVLGVQWHPEFIISEGDRRLFNAFVKAAS
jgi:putative glutamine amidotransferase